MNCLDTKAVLNFAALRLSASDPLIASVRSSSITLEVILNDVIAKVFKSVLK